MRKAVVTKKGQLYIIIIAIIAALAFFVTYATYWNKVVQNVAAFRVGLDTASIITVIMVLIIVYWDSTPVDNGTGLFFTMGICLYIDFLANALSWCMDQIPEYATWVKFVTAIQLATIPFLVLAFYYYQQTIYYSDGAGKSGRDIFVQVITIIDVAVIALSFFFPFYYDVDEMGVYSLGPAYSATFLHPIAVLALCVLESIRTKYPSRKKFALLIFSLAPLFIAIVTIFSGNTSYAHMVALVDLFLLYCAIQMEKARELSEKKASIAEQQRELERQNQLIMVSQIQPHFIFNTLSSIRQLCKSDEASAVILDFSNYLRMNLETLTADRCIPFEKELEHTKEYVRIEMLRFGDRVNVKYNIETINFEIPPLTLQPVVENAIKHGVCQKIEGGTVEISVSKQNDNYVVQISDDGVGFDPNQLLDGGKHIGMNNVKERVKSMAGGRMIIESIVGAGTMVQIIIPEKGSKEGTERE